MLLLFPLGFIITYHELCYKQNKGDNKIEKQQSNALLFYNKKLQEYLQFVPQLQLFTQENCLWLDATCMNIYEYTERRAFDHAFVTNEIKQPCQLIKKY